MVTIDFETRSNCDLKKAGAWAYSEHLSTDVLCMAWAYKDDAVQLWIPGQPFPQELKHLIEKERCLIEAHNAFFERSIWENIMQPRYGWPAVEPEQWRCSAAKASANALPRSLARLAEALRVSFKKDIGGRAVMLKLCKPKKITLSKDGKNNEELYWEDDIMDLWRLYEYCKKDVLAERAVSEVIRSLSPHELKVWQLDQAINHRGILVDVDACVGALYCLEEIKKSLIAEFIQLTGGTIDSPLQRDKLLEWLEDQGTSMTGLTKSDVVKQLEASGISDIVKRVLEIRQQLSKTSTAKFQAMLNSVSKDGRIRETLMYHGAATGRWTGKLVQMQNIPRGTVEVTEKTFQDLRAGKIRDTATITSCIRGMLVAAPGKEFIGADYASIEARVLFWLADEQKGLKAYYEKKDLYVEMARKIYPQTTEINKTQRMVGKTTILGCGYGMGPVKFRDALATNAGVDISEDFAQVIIKTYRNTYAAVPAMWYGYENAAITAIRNPEKKIACGKVIWGFDRNRVLYCKLPSGRLLAYNDAQVKPSQKWEGKLELSYMTASQGEWVRESTYGGKLVENVTQAVARDIMADAMLRLEFEGYPIVLSVHDEIIAEVGNVTPSDVERFVNIMTTLPPWAAGCPIEAEGWRGPRYKK